MYNIYNFLNDLGLKFLENGHLVTINCTNINVEDYIMLVEISNTYYVFEVHRNDKILKKNDKNKDKAILWAIILYKRLSDNVYNSNMVRKIKDMIKKGEDVKSLFNQFDCNIFSIGNKQENQICLIEDNDKASVIYNKKVIGDKVSLQRAYIILYNYCVRMESIINFYTKYSEYFEMRGITKDEVVDLYLS